MAVLFSLPVIATIFLLLAAFSFFLSASETSIIGLSKIRMRHMVAKGVKHAVSVQRLTTKLDKFIAAILIGNNFVNIAMSAIITVVCVEWLDFQWGALVSTFITTSFILVFCEITPKILAAKHTEKVALFIAPFMEGLIGILDPVIRVFIWISNTLLRIFGIKHAKRSPLITEEELRTMIEVGKEEGVLSDEERSMLHRIFEFGDTKVSEVMVPREKITAVDIHNTPETLLNTFVEEGHARLPVYSESIENVLGIIYARDLLYVLRDKGLFLLQDLLHQPYYVAAATRVNELLRKFQSEKIQIAIVVDDNKKTLGLVTLEDLIEEIVGEIEEVHGKNHTNKH